MKNDFGSILKPLPPNIIDLLKNSGIETDQFEASISSDLDMHGKKGESWLILTTDSILSIMPEPIEKDRIIGPFQLTKIEKIRIFRGIGSGFLQIRTEQLFIDIIRFSNARREEFSRISLYVDRFLKIKKKDREILLKPNPWICPVCGLMLPGKNAVCPKCAREGGLFLRTLLLMKPYSMYVAALLFMMLCGVGLDLLPPYLTRILVDDVLTTHKKPQLLVTLVLLLAGAALFRALLNILIGRTSTAIGTRVTYELRCRLHEKLSELSVDFHDRSSLGNLITRLLHDVDYFHGFVQQVAQGFFVNIFLVAGIGFMLFRLNFKLAFYVLIPIPFVMLGTWFFWHIIYPRYYRFWDSQSKMAALLNGMLSGIRTVKAFAQEARERLRFRDIADASRNARQDVDRATNTFFPLFGYVFGLGGLIIWYAGGKSVMEGKITLGTLMAFLGYLGMFYSPISALTMFSNWLTGFLTAGQRIFEILDTHTTLQKPANPISVPSIKGRIELRNVTFGYDPYLPVLKNVSMIIEPGQVVGIVGKSGAGKTTLINLVCRFYDPQEGQVLIDNEDVKNFNNNELRRHVGLVLQEPFLFRATIAENIAYGRPDATPRQIIDASYAANCHRFILRQAGGYDTRLGERGAGLSGGEKQRISIARALLCAPSVLILDEATSNVDTESEQEIQKALSFLTKGRTTIIIAHRLSTLRNADIIYVFDDGKIAEQGNHEALMAKEGIYHNLVMIQTKLTKIEMK